MNHNIKKINHLIDTLGYEEAFLYLKQIPLDKINSKILEIFLRVCKNICKHQFAFNLLEQLSAKLNNNLIFLYQKALFLKDYGFVLQSIQILNSLRKKNIHPEERKKIYYLIGEILWKSNRFNLALKFYLFFQKQYPNEYQISRNVLICHSNLGNFDGASSQLTILKKINPFDCGEDYRVVTQLKKFTHLSDPYIDEIKSLLAKDLNSNSKSQLLFALGKIHEDLSDYQQSANYYKEANNLKNIEYANFSIQKKIDQFENLKKVFNQKFLQSSETSNLCKSFFIVGMPRSGTTLLENILSSCEQISPGGELSTYSKYFNTIYQYRFNNSYKNFNENVTQKDLEDIGSFYNDEINRMYKSNYIINKLPHNFLYTGFISRSFKNTKIIHCTRDKNDVLLSIYKNFFAGRLLDFVYNTDNLKNYYHFYLDVMAYWVKVLDDNLIFELNYEKLIESPETELQLLFDYLEIKFDKKYLEFYKNSRGIKTLSINQANKKIYKDSKYKWKLFEPYIPELFS